MTSKVDWMSANDGFASVNDKGMVTAKRPAEEVTVKITALDPAGRAVPASAELTLEVAKDGKPPDAVDDSFVVDLFIDPENPTIVAGGKQQFKVDAMLSDDRFRDVTKDVIWTSSNPEILEMDKNEKGLFVARRAGGPVEITATYPDVKKPVSTKVTVIEGDQPKGTAPKLKSITIEPMQAMLAPRATQQFTAKAVYDDGSTKDVTSTIDWLVNDLAILTINAKGLTTAEAKAGNAEVTAMDAETQISSPSAKVTVR